MNDPVVIRGMSDADYHADPALSSTGAKLLLDCPARYRHAMDHPQQADTDAFRVGRAVHALVLGAGAEVVDIGPSLTTKAAKEKRDQAITDGHTWLRSGDYDTAHAMAATVLTDPRAAAALTRGEAEVSVWATDPTTGVRMRARPDYMRPGLVVDLKTTAAPASPDSFALEAGKRGYHLSAAFYLHVLSLAGLADEATVFLHVVVEKQAPYLVNVVQLDVEALAAGRGRTDAALRRFADCTAAGSWPGYESDHIPLVGLRPWHLHTPDDEGDDL